MPRRIVLQHSVVHCNAALRNAAADHATSSHVTARWRTFRDVLASPARVARPVQVATEGRQPPAWRKVACIPLHTRMLRVPGLAVFRCASARFGLVLRWEPHALTLRWSRVWHQCWRIV